MIHRFGDVGKAGHTRPSTLLPEAHDVDEEDVRQNQHVWRIVEMLSSPGTILLWEAE